MIVLVGGVTDQVEVANKHTRELDVGPDGGQLRYEADLVRLQLQLVDRGDVPLGLVRHGPNIGRDGELSFLKRRERHHV